MPLFVQKPLIFVLEDDSTLRHIICTYLQQIGYEAIGFATGEDLLGGLHHRLPFAVVSDINLGNIDGEAIARDAIALHPDLPIIILSARAESRDLSYARAVIPKGTDSLQALKQALEDLA